MSTLTVTADRLFTDLRAGDQITAIDGHRLPAPREVAMPRVATYYGGPEAVRLVNALGSGTEWNLYPGNVEVVTVERDTHRGGSLARKFEDLTAPQPVVTIEPVEGPRAWIGRYRDDVWEGRTPGPAVIAYGWSKYTRRAMMRNRHYEALLAKAAEAGPTGLLARGRGEGTQYGTLAAYYGWIERAPGRRWRITETGAEVLAAWRREQRGTTG